MERSYHICKPTHLYDLPLKTIAYEKRNSVKQVTFALSFQKFLNEDLKVVGLNFLTLLFHLSYQIFFYLFTYFIFEFENWQNLNKIH